MANSIGLVYEPIKTGVTSSVCVQSHFAAGHSYALGNGTSTAPTLLAHSVKATALGDETGWTLPQGLKTSLSTLKLHDLEGTA